MPISAKNTSDGLNVTSTDGHAQRTPPAIAAPIAGRRKIVLASSIAETSLTPAQWQGLADMGWFGMGLPEHAGGLGLSVRPLDGRRFARVRGDKDHPTSAGYTCAC